MNPPHAQPCSAPSRAGPPEEGERRPNPHASSTDGSIGTGADATFRDDALSMRALSRAVSAFRKQPPNTGCIRIWVPECGTGESVYGLAMYVRARLGPALALRLFGTSSDPSLVERARSGVYSAERVEAAIPAHWQRRYLLEAGEIFCISSAIRNSCVFGSLDLTVHPPLSQMDLIRWRGALGGAGSAHRRRLCEVFRFALRGRGYLLLGHRDGAEDLSGFELIDAAGGLYRRLDDADDVDTRRPPTPRRWARRCGERLAAGGSASTGDCPDALGLEGVADLVRDGVAYDELVCRVANELEMGLALVDEERRVSWMNRRMSAMLELDESSWRTARIHDVFPQAWVSAIDACWARALPPSEAARTPRHVRTAVRAEPLYVGDRRWVVLIGQPAHSSPVAPQPSGPDMSDELVMDPSDTRRLSRRERHVLGLVADGLSSKEIATELGIAPNTVETHRRHIMDKLELRTIAALTKFAVREGLSSP
jgi:chemotaxis methyl-accepting protein methylase/DNA-binding CsgD family transcriptional regulator